MKIIDTLYFNRNLKRLAKKYASLKNEVRELEKLLMVNPQLGDSLGYGCYKVRLAIASKGQGKRGGARVITYVQVVGETVYLLAIYDKGEQSTLTDQEVLQLLGQVGEE